MHAGHVLTSVDILAVFNRMPTEMDTIVELDLPPMPQARTGVLSSGSSTNMDAVMDEDHRTFAQILWPYWPA